MSLPGFYFLRIAGLETLAARLDDGIVKVFLNGSWFAVCGEEWGILEAKVICRQLGYLGADSNQSTAPIANASHAVWSQGLQCAGNEDDLSNCYGSSNWRFTECGNSRAASVVCTLKCKGLHAMVQSEQDRLFFRAGG